jgi:hypothetical protein
MGLASLVEKMADLLDLVVLHYTNPSATRGALHFCGVTMDAAQDPVFTGYADGRMKARASQSVIAQHGYLTPQEKWGDVERGNPLPYTLPLDERLAVGLERQTWSLEIVAHPQRSHLQQRGRAARDGALGRRAASGARVDGAAGQKHSACLLLRLPQ